MAASLDAVLPELAEGIRYLDQVVHASGLQGRITSTMRTHAEQKRLYDRYVRGGAQFPAAPPGQSAHEYGFAVDYVVSPYEYQADVGAFWVEMGGVWHASDAVHFEYPGFAPPTGTIGEWIDSTFGGLPWWVNLLTPFWSMTADDTPAVRERILKKLRSMGILS